MVIHSTNIYSRLSLIGLALCGAPRIQLGMESTHSLPLGSLQHSDSRPWVSYGVVLFTDIKQQGTFVFFKSVITEFFPSPPPILMWMCILNFPLPFFQLTPVGFYNKMELVNLDIFLKGRDGWGNAPVTILQLGTFHTSRNYLCL